MMSLIGFKRSFKIYQLVNYNLLSVENGRLLFLKSNEYDLKTGESNQAKNPTVSVSLKLTVGLDFFRIRDRHRG